METQVPDLRLEVPCSDEGDFFARLADRVAERGLRVPTDERRAVGTAVTVVLELRNGETITGAGVIDAHVLVDGRPGVNVRILRFAPGGSAAERDPDAPAAARARRGPGPAGAAREETPALPPGDEPLGEVVPLAEVLEDVPGFLPAASFGSTSVSGQIVAAVARRTARAQRAALAAILAALLVGAGGLAAARWLPASADAAVGAHLEAADGLFAEGRLTGEGGALEHLLAAKRLRPGDPATEGRLSRVADLLEGLAARALERGDVAVAAVHLTWAERAAPDRASIRARLDALVKGASASEAPPPPRRGKAGARERRVAPR